MPDKKLLIVEDEKPIARAMELKLKRSGFEVLTVYNGQEAMDALTREQFDMVIMDLIMPVKNGFDVLAEMKEKGIQVPVIVTSNLGQEEDRKRVEALGAIGYLVKSDTSLADIVASIKQALNVSN